MSPVYLRRSKKGGENLTNSWKSFFIKLGVKLGITVERVDEHISEVIYHNNLCCSAYTSVALTPSIAKKGWGEGMTVILDYNRIN